jgi:spore coat polysaccharide biosynthesis protein SpsF (cytidylyltransferase family)
MPDPEISIIIELPWEIDSKVFLTPVRDNKCPLEILYERLSKIVPPADMIFLTGHEPHHLPYGNFAAVRSLFLFRTYEDGRLHQFNRAISSRRMKTAIRVNACHVFADPEILAEMLEFHIKQKVMHSYLEGVPDWLGGEIFQRSDMIDAFVGAEKQERLGEEPGLFMRSNKELYTTAAYKPKIRGHWKNVDLSLATSPGFTIDTIKRAPDPIAVTYRDFL